MVSIDDGAFYTIADARFFPGLVGLLNSLRLTGHNGELVVLDCGLTPRQRDRLGPHCTLVDRPRDHVPNPTLFKAWPYLLNPTGTVVIIDSDMVVTKSLDPIRLLAQRGKICAFPDPESTRWFGEWERLFQLRGELRQEVYVNAGFVAFSTRQWPDLLEHWWQACQRIWSHPTLYEGAPDGPSSQADQDALNALLMSEVPTEALAVHPEAEAPAAHPLWCQEVQVVDVSSLACTHRGHATTLLHNAGPLKPWEYRSWRVVRRHAYTRLLQRLLLEQDAPLRLAPAELPIWLHQGILGQLTVRGLDIVNAPQAVRLRGRPRRLVARLTRARLTATRFGNTRPGK